MVTKKISEFLELIFIIMKFDQTEIISNKPWLKSKAFSFRRLSKTRQIYIASKNRRENSGEVFRAMFDLRPHLVVDILNCELFVTRVTDMDTTVKLVGNLIRV